MAKEKSMPGMSGKQIGAMFLVFMLVHSAIIYVASNLFPNAIVLGTNLFTPMMALFYSMLVFTLVAVGATPIIETVSEKYKLELKDKDWMILYFAINTGAFWLIARMAEVTGFGISSWIVAAALGLIMDVVQGMLVMTVVSKVK